MTTIRDILRPGITGCLLSKRDPEQVTEADVSRWLSACHAAARTMQARLQPLRPVETARNFHTVGMDSHSTGPMFLVLHAVLPIVAALRYAEYGGDEEYLDLPLSAAELGDRFMIVSKETLDAPFVLEHWMRDALGSPALNDIRHWRPRRIGELVFNYYD